jgi:hypothetical protein
MAPAAYTPARHPLFLKKGGPLAGLRRGSATPREVLTPLGLIKPPQLYNQSYISFSSATPFKLSSAKFKRY